MPRLSRYIYILLFACLPALNCPLTAQESPASIRFELRFNGNPFSLEQAYTTPLGEEITIYKFLFYVSGLRGITAKGDTLVLSREHYLVSAADSSSRLIGITAPEPLTQLLFSVGVDSMRNTSGVQTGVLDPARGMFWTWNSGYIMMKMEGESAAAQTAGHRFTHDVGGFRSPFNTVRSISLPLRNNNSSSAGQIIRISAELSKWFTGKHPIRLSQEAICHMPGALAMKLADNGASLFTLLNE